MTSIEFDSTGRRGDAIEDGERGQKFTEEVSKAGSRYCVVCLFRAQCGMLSTSTFSLKTLLQGTNWLWALVRSLGPWGVFAAAALDGAGVPLPGAVDVVLVAYVYQRPLLAWAYVLLAASGSMLGCLVLYTIGVTGGEVLIQKRMAPSKYDKIRRDFEEHPVITVALPALLPPPFPFKIFVLSAGAFAMRRTHFLAVILVARLVRYGILSLLAIRFGPQVVTGFNQAFRGHPGLTTAVILAVVAIALGAHRMRRNPPSQVAE